MKRADEIYLDYLKHYGVLGMKWGIRRYQNKDGSLTPEGRLRLANKNIRTAENLSEKTIPKGTKMYRTTPNEKDGRTGKSAYVTYQDADRAMYREGSLVRKYVGKQYGESVYEHEFELKTDIRIPSLDTVREIEKKVVANEKKRQEVARSWIEQRALNEGFTSEDVAEISKLANKIEKNPTDKQYKKVYDEAIDKYGLFVGDYYYYEAVSFATAKNWLDTNDFLIIEQSLGKADGVKTEVIRELKKQGYNAMYDNASIGIGSDGKYNKYQEGVEPLIIFDADATLKNVSTTEVGVADQKKAHDEYMSWKKERDETLRKFQ